MPSVTYILLRPLRASLYTFSSHTRPPLLFPYIDHPRERTDTTMTTMITSTVHPARSPYPTHVTFKDHFRMIPFNELPSIIKDPHQYLLTSGSAVPISKLKSPTLTWLWHHLVPKGSLILLQTTPSCGSSTLMLELAARVTSGLPLPDPFTGLLPDSPDTASNPRPTLPSATPSSHQSTPPTDLPSNPAPSPSPTSPAPVMLITPDDPSLTRTHTFLAHNSSHSKLAYSINTVTMVDTLSGDCSSHPFRLTFNDLNALASEIARLRPSLLIIDPFPSLFETPRPFNEYTLISLLDILLAIVSTYQIACILVQPTLPRGQGTRLQRSIQPFLKSSTVLSLTPDPLSPDHTLLVPVKTSFAQPTPILRFHLSPDPRNPELPCISWDGLSDLTPEQLATASTEPTGTLSASREHILRILAQHNEPVDIPTLSAAIPSLTYGLLRQTLHRMIQDHQIAKPLRGKYTLPSKHDPHKPLNPPPAPTSDHISHPPHTASSPDPQTSPSQTIVTTNPSQPSTTTFTADEPAQPTPTNTFIEYSKSTNPSQLSQPSQNSIPQSSQPSQNLIPQSSQMSQPSQTESHDEN
jgi:hypothetical protein